MGGLFSRKKDEDAPLLRNPTSSAADLSYLSGGIALDDHSKDKREVDEKGQDEEDALDGLDAHATLRFYATTGNIEKMREAYQLGGRVTVPDKGKRPAKSDDDDADDGDGNHAITWDCALHIAVGGGHQEAVRSILNWEPDIEAKNRIGSTALHRAVSSNEIDIVKILLKEGANIRATNKIGNTPLHLAAYGGFVEITKLLLDAKATQFVHMSNGAGMTPLSYARLSSKVVTQLFLDFEPLTAVDGKTSPSSKHAGMDLREAKWMSKSKLLLEAPTSPPPPGSLSSSSNHSLSRNTSGGSGFSIKVDGPGTDKQKGVDGTRSVAVGGER